MSGGAGRGAGNTAETGEPEEEELLEKKINRDSCQPKKFDYVGSAGATLG